MVYVNQYPSFRRENWILFFWSGKQQLHLVYHCGTERMAGLWYDPHADYLACSGSKILSWELSFTRQFYLQKATVTRGHRLKLICPGVNQHWPRVQEFLGHSNSVPCAAAKCPVPSPIVSPSLEVVIAAPHLVSRKAHLPGMGRQPTSPSSQCAFFQVPLRQHLEAAGRMVSSSHNILGGFTHFLS